MSDPPPHAQPLCCPLCGRRLATAAASGAHLLWLTIRCHRCDARVTWTWSECEYKVTTTMDEPAR